MLQRRSVYYEQKGWSIRRFATTVLRSTVAAVSSLRCTAQNHSGGFQKPGTHSLLISKATPAKTHLLGGSAVRSCAVNEYVGPRAGVR